MGFHRRSPMLLTVHTCSIAWEKRVGQASRSLNDKARHPHFGEVGGNEVT